MTKSVKIIGCGLSGITAAVLLKEKGYLVTIFEKRTHIGGNCYDMNINDVNVHKYGPHIFHTNDEEVFAFLSRFTGWFSFKNQPKGVTDAGIISLPYSRKTVKELGRELSQDEIVDLIFKGYSEKQWGVPFDEIPKSITNRVPKTKDCEDPTWYEGEKYQCLPYPSYTKMMENMLEGISVRLGVTDDEWRNFNADHTVFTGKVDEYYNYRFGKLPYRTLDFDVKINSQRLDNPVLNYNQKEKPYTRVVDYGYFTHNYNSKETVVVVEYPRQYEKETDIPYYPIPFGTGTEMYKKYKELADQEKDTIFIGRLATYTYLDMWMAVKQAMIKIKNTSW
jgi:UDP-galactopyranose mutase